MVKLKLPYWLRKGHLKQLIIIATAWWDLVESWVRFALSGHDIETVDEQRLLLSGWERDINRFDGEPISLYRKRVKFAYLNAFDSGSVVGFKRIMQRLDVGEIEIRERQPGYDWDIIFIDMDDDQFGGSQDLIEVIIQYYGRTCRRYFITITNTFELGVGCSSWSDSQENYEAVL